MNMIAGIGFMRSYYRGPDIRFYFTQKDWLDRRVLLLSANWYDNHLVCLYDNSKPIYQ
jgi:hypothetical protein